LGRFLGTEGVREEKNLKTKKREMIRGSGEKKKPQNTERGALKKGKK